MPGSEFTEMIAEVVEAAGRGAESLRRAGAELVLQECAIDVTIDAEPGAHVRILFGDRPNGDQGE